jgi:large subunit ribosomal protein L24
MQRIKKGDTIVVCAGKDKGKESVVTLVLKNNKVLVKGVNTVKKHQKGNPNAGIQTGIVDKDMPIDMSNIGLYNPETKKADRVGFRILEDGRKVRYFKSTSKVIDV